VGPLRGVSQIVLLALLWFSGAVPAGSRPAQRPAAKSTQQADNKKQTPGANAHSYIDDPIEKIIQSVPELETLQPAADQQALAMILKKTGEGVDEFFRDVFDLVADEDITQQRQGWHRKVTQQVQDNYLLHLRGNVLEAKLEEYRTDAEGNRLRQVGADRAFFVNSGFASSREYFSVAVQEQSDFRYLGEDIVDSRETYVVAFAEKPDAGAVTVENGGVGRRKYLLVQGIAWVDKKSFQILQMQTELVAPEKEMGLDQLRTLVKFGEVQPEGVARPLWLPNEAEVRAEVSEPQFPDFQQKFQNDHDFTNYRVYHAAAAAAVPAETNEQNPYAKVHPYLEEPLEKLAKRIPELKALQPATDQQLLPMILEKTGEKVDDLFGNLVGLKAKEVVSEEQFSWKGRARLQQDQYDYFIVRKGNFVDTTIEEYRRDADRNEIAPEVSFVSSGFASSVLYFSKAFQQESTYRYIGQELVGTRSAYVVAFAQIPGKATISVKIRTQESRKKQPQSLAWADKSNSPLTGKPEGLTPDVLVQGIAWVDRNSFQILQMRTDLLAHKIQLGDVQSGLQERLEELRTVVTFSQAQSPELTDFLWMPSEADVYAEFEEHFLNPYGGDIYADNWLRNVHHFSNYGPYRGPGGYSASLNRSEQRNDAKAHPYLEDPLKQLIKQIPELKGIRPAADQQPLPMILRQTGKKVDEFFDNLVDLIAHEEITQERLNSIGAAIMGEQVRDSYLILRRGDQKTSHIDEYRMDEKGNRKDDVGLDKGFFVTLGFALSCVHFSIAFQPDSTQRYLGDQKIGGRDTYVVAFAQKPGRAVLMVTMRGPRGTSVNMLVQGIVWVDKENFHILRMRTDLLARQPEIGLNEQTTKVKFGEVRLADVATPLWLPREVNVNIKFGEFGDRRVGEAFQNVHHYTNYRRYRVSSKMVTPK
jgi:hypothetical protein